MKRNILLILIFFIFLSTNIFADEDGGRPGYFLNQGGGARALGMGRAYVAICDDASAVMWNPAGLYQIDQKEINTMYVSLFEDTHYGYIGYAHPTTGVFSYGISALSLYSGELIKRDSNNNPGGTFYDMNNAVLIGLSYSKVPELSFGLNAKWINKIFDDLKTSGFGIDMGMLFELHRNFVIGLNLQNVIAAQIKREKLTDKAAFNIKGGIAYKLFNKKLILGVDLDKTAKCDLRIHSGGEFSFPVRPYTIAVRGGYDQGNPSFGLGIKRWDYQIDYAMLYYTNELGISHRVSFDVKFGLTKYEVEEINKKSEQIKSELRKKKEEAKALKKEKEAKIKSLLSAANEYYKAEEWDKAISECRKAQEIDPGHKKAADMIEDINNIKLENTIIKHFSIATQYYADKKWDNVISECKKVLIIDPNNIRANQMINEVKEIKNKIDQQKLDDELKKTRTIAILDFKAKDVSAADASFVTEFLREDLVMSGKVTVVERSNLDQILAEQGFQQTGCTEQDCAVQIGKLLNINSIIIGSFGRLLNTYQITIRLIDVETGKIVYADNETCYTTEDLKPATKRLANRLIGKVLK